MAASLVARIAAYCSPTGLEVFSGIVHGNQIWTPDLFDVEAVHARARAEFATLLNRASSSELPASGKILLVLGEGGSGKTHLMRAFRAATHSDGAGYCGYLQLATKTDHYARYVLSKLIDSLERPYKFGQVETGLKRLAHGVLDAIDVIAADERQRLCDDLLEPAEVEELVLRLAYFAFHPRQ
jgi:AAA ATPase domain